MTKRNAYRNNGMQLKNRSLTFLHKIKSLLLAINFLFRSPMAYNTTACWDKLTCTDYLDFGKCGDKFGQFFWSKNDFYYFDVKLKLFKKDDNKEFPLVKNFCMGEADFHQFMRLRNHLVIAVENFTREEHLTPMPIPTMSRDMDEQLKLAHKVVDVDDRADRKICLNLLRYNVDKPESSYADVRLIARKKEDEEFQHVVYVNYKLE